MWMPQFYLSCIILLQSEIFKALKTTRLLVGDKKDSQHSRCGRTDKGVSSVGQVSWWRKGEKKRNRILVHILAVTNTSHDYKCWYDKLILFFNILELIYTPFDDYCTAEDAWQMARPVEVLLQSAQVNMFSFISFHCSFGLEDMYTPRCILVLFSSNRFSFHLKKQ